jgi:hypothetical protein
VLNVAANANAQFCRILVIPFRRSDLNTMLFLKKTSKSFDFSLEKSILKSPLKIGPFVARSAKLGPPEFT